MEALTRKTFLSAKIKEKELLKIICFFGANHWNIKSFYNIMQSWITKGKQVIFQNIVCVILICKCLLRVK